MTRLSLYLLALYFSIWMFIHLCIKYFEDDIYNWHGGLFSGLYAYVIMGFILLYILTLIFIKIRK